MTKTEYHIGDALHLTLELKPARFGLSPEDLFEVAVRQNPNRAFLFVSRVLGKHLPVAPAALLSAGKLLAEALLNNNEGEEWAAILKNPAAHPFASVMERLEQTRRQVDVPTLLIGFAETATGLARAVADAFEGDLRYISSTRVTLPGPAPLTFDESHSHARTHLLHLDPADPFLRRTKRIVLVDDELTTGRTALRLIERLHEALGVREFVLLTLLDNSGDAERLALEARLGISVRVCALLEGRIVDAQTGHLPQALPLGQWQAPPVHTRRATLSAPLADDRRPLSADDLAACRAHARETAQSTGLTAGPGDLFLGTGEFIYYPALVAGYRGASAFHSLTQSPVLPCAGSAIVSGARFPATEAYSAAGYVYNIPPHGYPRAVIFAERAWAQEDGLDGLAHALLSQNVKQVEVVLTCCH